MAMDAFTRAHVLDQAQARARFRIPASASGSESDNVRNCNNTVHERRLRDEEEEESPRISRNEQKRRLKKQRREEQKQRQQAELALIPTISTTTTLLDPRPPSPKDRNPPNILPKNSKVSLSVSAAMPPPSTYHPLLVCSIGNPGPQYASTLHSAGHTILSTIRERGLYQPFASGLSGKVARPDTTTFRFSITGFSKEKAQGLAPGEDDFTLWQSTKLMNVSGPSVAAAWRQFAGQGRFQAEGQTPRLVVVHDELESPLGKVSIKDGASSPRGHNGLKSVQASLGTRVKWWRVGVGIGRPESREPSVVSKYVLRKMTDREERAMDAASLGVLEALRKIADGKA
ncbi:peptidyl-tRNA hydrolase [Westerdykella ornata]|uniref:peptidyl-tRNA hydrolase n=1 Tax=Westerdykella ornata TaxID=318751 RepID=A0A6A6J6V7_WESOR|nr:peptidyl-tRNA hydrolase [Westerdykella ornata]KAF2272311.1 peptidyl-tRNA hydrolase [Westerdykella ornata]